MPKRTALVIGVSEYPPPVSPLPGVRADVRAVAGLFADGGAATVLADRDATGSRITAALRDAFRTAGAEDTLFVYLSGHGAADGRDYYFLPADYTPGRVRDTGVPLRRVKEWFDAAPAARVLLLLDCCHAGGVLSRSAAPAPAGPAPDALRDTLGDVRGSGRVILAACTPDQAAYEAGRHGVFTGHLLDGLRGAAAHAGEVTVASLFDYIDRRCGALQRPVLFGQMAGRVVLADRPAAAPDEAARRDRAARLCRDGEAAVRQFVDGGWKDAGRLHEAFRLATKALEYDPRHPAAFALRARALMHDTPDGSRVGGHRTDEEQQAAALRDVGRAIALCPDDADLLLLRAEIWGVSDDVEKAVQDLRQALALAPGCLPVYEALFEIYENEGDYTQVAEVCRAVFALDLPGTGLWASRYEDALVALAEECERAGDADGALRHLAEAGVDDDPESDPERYVWTTRLHLKRGDAATALDRLTGLEGWDPEDLADERRQGLLIRGDALWQLRDFRRAVACYQALLDEHYRDECSEDRFAEAFQFKPGDGDDLRQKRIRRAHAAYVGARPDDDRFLKEALGFAGGVDPGRDHLGALKTPHWHEPALLDHLTALVGRPEYEARLGDLEGAAEAFVEAGWARPAAAAARVLRALPAAPRARLLRYFVRLLRDPLGNAAALRAAVGSLAGTDAGAVTQALAAVADELAGCFARCEGLPVIDFLVLVEELLNEVKRTLSGPSIPE